MGLSGSNDMIAAGWEAAAFLNQRPGASGVSASMMLFGQRLRLYGELYSAGEPEAVGHHPEATHSHSWHVGFESEPARGKPLSAITTRS